MAVTSGPVSERAAASRERLAFNYGPGTVPGRDLVEAALAAEAKPTFATAAYAEPRDWGYFGLLAFTTVLMVRPQDQIPALGVLRIAELCAIIGIAPMILHRFARRLPVFRVTSETVGLVVFGAAILLSVPFSIWPGGALGVFTGAYLKILIVFVLMMNTLTTPARLAQITWLILLCCGYICTLSVFNWVRGVNLVEGGRLAGPLAGMFGNPNDLAMNMVTFLPAAAIIAGTRRYTMLRRVTAAGIAALMLATIVFTQSRGAALGLGASVLVLVLLGRKVRRGFGTLALVAVIAALPFVPRSYWARMSSMFDARQDQTEFTGSREARRVVFMEGVQAFMDNPITGVGAGQFANYKPEERRERWRETHNAILQVAAETGILGLLAYCFLIVRAGVGAASTRRMLSRTRGKREGEDPLAYVMGDEDRRAMVAHTVAMTAGLAGWFVCALFASVAFNWTFYYLLALIVAGRELTRDRLAAARALTSESAKSVSVPSQRTMRRAAVGHA